MRAVFCGNPTVPFTAEEGAIYFDTGYPLELGQSRKKSGQFILSRLFSLWVLEVIMKKYLAVVLALFSLLISASEEAIDCDNALTTLDINHCASMELDRAHVEMTKYLEASYKQHACDAQIIEAITSAQEHWETYLDAHCHSVYTKWREGTIRDVMSISCRTKLTGQRTHELWENFLTYMDGASSVLPEPK